MPEKELLAQAKDVAIAGGGLTIVLAGIAKLFKSWRAARKETDGLARDIVEPIVKEYFVTHDSLVDAHALAFSYRDGAIRESLHAISEEMRILHSEQMGRLDALLARWDDHKRSSDDRIDKLERRVENIERKCWMHLRRDDSITADPESEA